MKDALRNTSNIWLTGASSGIGAALTHALIDGGHNLIVTGRRAEPLEQLRARAPNRISVGAADTTSQDDLVAIAPILDSFGSLNMAILNAGTCDYVDIAKYNSEVIGNNIITNVMGTARSLDIALPALRRARAEGKPATLVIVSSSAWWLPFTRAEGYGASKAALNYFGLCLRADLAAEGIDVVVVSPGFVKTPLTDRNDFPMPFVVTAEEAAQRIIKGLRKGQRDIAFPKRFTWTMKLLATLPQPVIDRIAASMARQSIAESSE